MVPLISLFVIVLASLLVTRVATVMLTLTGLSRESARFQARSAFTGAGFTTSESEAITDHPFRRRIVMWLMLLGNASIVSGLASLLLSFSTANSGSAALVRLALILLFLLALNRLAVSGPADRLLSRVIDRGLRRFTRLDVRDYAGLLRLRDNWVVGEIVVAPGDWFIDRTIEDVDLSSEGVLVLGIERTGHRYVGAPKSTARFREGDKVVLYGLRDTLDRIDARERTADGEMDWIASQIEFTENYLLQQEAERQLEAEDDTSVPDEEPKLRAGERPDGSSDRQPDSDSPSLE